MGTRGYHIHDKQSGVLLGVIDPSKCQKFHHIIHPDEPRYPLGYPVDLFPSLLQVEVFPPTNPTRGRSSPIEIRDGRFEDGAESARLELENDEWGAGILVESMMVGISRGGRMFVLLDWRLALREPKSIETNSYLVECDVDATSHQFDFGGWLSVRNDRALFEIRDHVYVIALERSNLGRHDRLQRSRPSYCFISGSVLRSIVPISYMSIDDDCIMSTYPVRKAGLVHPALILPHSPPINPMCPS
jgi:hypothetical protein